MTFDTAKSLGFQAVIGAGMASRWLVWWRPQRHKRRLIRLGEPPWGWR